MWGIVYFYDYDDSTRVNRRVYSKKISHNFSLEGLILALTH